MPVVRRSCFHSLWFLDRDVRPSSWHERDVLFHFLGVPSGMCTYPVSQNVRRCLSWLVHFLWGAHFVDDAFQCEPLFLSNPFIDLRY